METTHNPEECREELQRTREELKAKTETLESTLASVSLLYQVTSTLASIENSTLLYKTLLEQIGKRLGSEIGIVYTIDTKASHYEALYALGVQEGERTQISGTINKTLLEEIFVAHKISRLYAQGEDIAPVHAILLSYHPKALLTAPIETKEGTPVFIQFVRCTNEEFTIEDERIVRILLNKAGSVLDAIVAQQKLEARTAELERMNNLMLGRELRIADLKKELADLRAATPTPKEAPLEGFPTEEVP